MNKPLRKSIDVIIKALPTAKNILEVGSREVDNQDEITNLRSLFPNSKYVGIDMVPGTGVDKVVNAEKLPFKEKSFDLVLCFETLEHAQKPWLIAKEIEKVLSPNGVIIVSSPQNYPLHLHPSDYFRYTPYGLSSLFNNLPNKLLFSISPPFDDEVKLNPDTVVLIGWGKKNTSLKTKIKKSLTENIDLISVHKPYRHRIIDCLKYFRRGLQELFYKRTVEFFE